jgi:hypothetical protein
VREDIAPDDVVEALEIPPGAPVVVRESHMRATASGERWSVGESYYPAEGLDADAIAILMSPDEMNYDDIESAYSERSSEPAHPVRQRPRPSPSATAIR